MILLLTGPAGAGKTTVGMRLAERLDWPFEEGDRFHSAESIRKMSEGIPLTEEDRRPWLEALRARIEEYLEDGQDAVMACSALKRSHRAVLQRKGEEVFFIRLAASQQTLLQRLRARTGHFAGADLLSSQLATLEDDDNLVFVDAHQPVDDIVEAIAQQVESDAFG